MEDPADARSPMKSSDEKSLFENAVTSTWIASATDRTRSLSEKLLSWGVEERGAYHVVILGFLLTRIVLRHIANPTLCQLIGIRPVDVEDRTETHFIKIFFVWLSANMNILPCVCLFP
jgi:hypothetical protein